MQLGGHALIGAVSGRIAESIYGGDFWNGFREGAVTGAYGYVFNNMAHAMTVGWEIALAEPTPAGELAMGVLTVGVVGYEAYTLFSKDSTDETKGGHDKGTRPSTKGKRDKGDTGRTQDQKRTEKGDARRKY